METSTAKDDLHRYLRDGREALLWKLEGLSEYDARRPLTPTGTNLLGLVKHVATVASGYFGVTFGRPFPEELPWMADGADRDADMWAAPDESLADVTALHHRVWRHADATIEALPLDATGRVPWWPAARGEVSLHRILLHMATETHRHAGHADILRELLDGTVGRYERDGGWSDRDRAATEAHWHRLERTARQAGRG